MCDLQLALKQDSAKDKVMISTDEVYARNSISTFLKTISS